MVTFKTRSQEKEIMDLGIPSYEETVGNYRLIRSVNRFLGGSQTILTHLARFSRSWSKDALIRILDVGSGAADIPQAIIRWGRRRGYPISVVAVDRDPHVIRFARQALEDYPEITWVRALSPSLPFGPASFDYVISSLFFHHLSEGEIVETLQTFDRLARRGIVVNDLLRRRRAYLGIFLLSRFSRNQPFRKDAPLSVLRGFQRSEIEPLVAKAGLGYLKFCSHFAYRFAIAGEKEFRDEPKP